MVIEVDAYCMAQNVCLLCWHCARYFYHPISYMLKLWLMPLYIQITAKLDNYISYRVNLALPINTVSLTYIDMILWLFKIIRVLCLVIFC